MSDQQPTGGPPPELGPPQGDQQPPAPQPSAPQAPQPQWNAPAQPAQKQASPALVGIVVALFGVYFYVTRDDHGPARQQPPPPPPAPVEQVAPAPVPKPASAAPKAAPTPSDLPWVAAVKANCDAYKAAPNEIKKSAIFNANEAAVTAARIVDARGVLAQLKTNQGGADATLEIHSGDVVFRTVPFAAYAIAKGSPIYDAAAELAVGQCVIFSADKVHATSLSEMAKVCSTEYAARITALKACP